jgi:hypothetical protein
VLVEVDVVVEVELDVEVVVAARSATSSKRRESFCVICQWAPIFSAEA